MNRGLQFGVVLLVVGALAVAPLTVSADTTTLTVAVETREGGAVSNATIVANWDGGSTTATTANNGKAFVDVPDGERVELVIEHEDYTRNFPYVVQDSADVSSDVVVPVGEKASLSLTVRDSEGVVDNPRVAVRWNDRLVTSQQTGDDGTLELQTVEAGTYDVTVEKPGYYVKQTTVDVTNATEATIQLESGGVPFEFNVTDSHFDPAKPVGAATVDVERVGTFQTGQDGLATGRIPVNSEVDVSVTKDGYETVNRTLTVNETGGTVHVDLQRTPNLTIAAVNERVVAGESVVVTVRNEYDEPVEGATILRNDSTVTTSDANGQAVVPLDTPGTWALSATEGDVTARAVHVVAIDTSPDTTTTTGVETDSDTEASTTNDVSVPGFSVATAILAALLSALLVLTASWRRRT